MENRASSGFTQLDFSNNYIFFSKNHYSSTLQKIKILQKGCEQFEEFRSVGEAYSCKKANHHNSTCLTLHKRPNALPKALLTVLLLRMCHYRKQFCLFLQLPELVLEEERRGRTAKFSSTEDLLLIREVAAAKAHIAEFGEMSKRFQVAASRANENPNLRD